MYSFRSILALVVVLIASCSHITNAHSTPPRPLKRVAQPSTIALEILPRQAVPALLGNAKRSLPPDANTLRSDDSFRLILSAFDQDFHLHLQPNDHLIHPAASVTYHQINPDGTTTSHTEPLIRESIKAYYGDVVHPDHSPTRLREDAARVVPQPHPATLGWARIMVHHQGDMELGIPPMFEGAFSSDGEVYHIMLKDSYARLKNPYDPDISEPLGGGDPELVIWRESDVMSTAEEQFARTGHVAGLTPTVHSCGHDKLDFNTDPMLNSVLQKPLTPTPWFSAPFGSEGNSSLFARDDAVGDGMSTNFKDSIGSTVGCPRTQKILFMGVAADCEYVLKYGSQANATRQILTTWNTASALYKTNFNVSLGIVQVQIQPPQCPVTASADFPWNLPCAGTDLDDRLSIFSKWRGDKGPGDQVGLWHLMSACATGSEVGIAWLGTLCRVDVSSQGRSFVSGTAVSTAGRTEWQVVAHEIGHNFGAIHDCTDSCTATTQCCPRSTTSCSAGSEFIMSPVAQAGEKTFSQCTIGNICSLLGGATGNRLNTTCLGDPGDARTTIGLGMCGNGIVEQGEQCDPGVGVDTPCCDSTTCRFKGNAVCDPRSSPCCTDQCTFSPATQLCRPTTDSKCDTPEFCTGNSSACPADVTAPNGQSCGADDRRCASGQCTSLSLQCATVGASMNLSEGCPNRGDNSCQVSCKAPGSNGNQCILLSALLVDGSPCGFGGTCLKGQCQAGSVLETAKAWYVQNLQISIPITVVAGLVALLILWALISSMCRCCRRKPKPIPIPDPVIRPPGAPPARSTFGDRMRGYDQTGGLRTPNLPAALRPGNASSSYTRLGPHQRDDSNSRTGWVDETLYNGRRQQ